MRALLRLTLCLVALVPLLNGHTAALAADSPDAQELVRVAGLGDLTAVQRQLAAGVDVNARTHTGDTALIAAAAGKHRDLVLALLAAKAKPDLVGQGQWTALFHATLAGDVEMAEALIRAGANVDIAPPTYGGGRTPLMAAISNGDLPMALLLLDAGASVHATTSYGATALWFSAWRDTPDFLAMTRALLQAGASVDAGQHPSYRLAGNTVTNVITTPDGAILPVASVTVGARTAEGTVLGYAARNGSTGQMRLLLEAGAKVDARQPGWMTPLMLAAAAGKFEAVRLLLEAGADVTATDSAGRNALVHARTGGNPQVISLLADARADDKR